MVVAKNLNVRIVKNGRETVNVSLPAQCARWFVDFIPKDALEKINQAGIPIDEIHHELKGQEVLYPRSIFELVEQERSIYVSLI